MKTLLLILLLIPIISFGQTPDYVPSNGNIGWWPFNGNSIDESGNGNNGTVNGATLTTDRFGSANSAYNFDGTDYSDIDIPSSPSLTISNDVTISFWIFHSNPGFSGERHLIDRDLCGSGTPDWRILQFNNTVRWSTGVSGSDQYISVSLIANQWNFIIAKRDGDTFTLNNNNSIANESQMTLSTNLFNNNNISILFGDAVCNSPSQPNFLGQLDDIGIWNRALTQQEAEDLFNSCTPSSSTDSHTACESYAWIDGNIYTSSNNIATYITPNTNGCDSTITLDLTITPLSTSSLIETACSFYVAPDDEVYTSTGSYTATIDNAAGCDSVIYIDLTIHPLPSNEVIGALNGNALIATQTSATYQWLDCDNSNTPIEGEVNQTYFPSTTGNYAVIVTVNGCSIMSECILVSFTGIVERNKTPKQLVKIVDVLGRKTPFKPNTPLLYIYNDGTVERKMIIE